MDKRYNRAAIDFSEKMLERASERANSCSVPDTVKGLKEIRRVCKPNGKIVMVEHVRSEKKVMGLIMDLLNPIVVNTYGANINRRTVDNIKAAGFTAVNVVDLYSDIVKKIMIFNRK